MLPNQETPPLHVIPTPTVFPVGPSNIILYTGSPVTLFDAGTNTEEAYLALIQGLKTFGIEIQDIRQVILTHHHLDHIGLAKRIKEQSGALVLSHVSVPQQIPFIFNEKDSRQHLESLMCELGAPDTVIDAVIDSRLQLKWLREDIKIDALYEDGAEIGEFTVHHRPGHSTTDTVFVHKKEKWAITGDHLIEKVTPNPLLRRYEENGHREKSLVQYCASLIKTREQFISWCFPGHGKAFKNHLEMIDSTLSHIEKRSRRIQKNLPADGATPYEMTLKLFPSVPESMFYYCISAITSHLELLEEQNHVVSEYLEDVLHYYPV